MTKIRISITEDEALIADNLAYCLEDLGYEVVSISDNAAETIGNLTIHQPDIALIDIQIRGEMDGIQLAKIIREQFRIPFIYITSNSESATIEKLKETQPAGFILKPFSTSSLGPVIEIALHNASIQKMDARELIQVDDALFIKDKHSLIKIRFTEILFAEARSNYTLIQTSDNRFLLSQTLKSIEEKLVPNGFMRIHRSYIVNIREIDEIRAKNVRLKDTELPLSESYRPDLLERIQLL
ncbi:MAG: LytR/AlgR family response regulator transcription factor [Fluviicola sp.]